MKTPRSTQAGFVWLPVLLVILAILAVSGGAYWYGHQKVSSVSDQTNLGGSGCSKSTDNGKTWQSVPCVPAPEDWHSVPVTATQSATTSQTISVPGMSKYTDADFGFSFWYPSSWTVKSTDKKTLTIVPPSDPSGLNGSSITISKYYSPTREISTAQDMCSPMQGYVIAAKRYYFDIDLRSWMVEVGATTNYSQKDGSQYTTPTTTKAADTSANTMGGLHQFSAGCTGEVIPLSAHNFLVFSYRHVDSPPYYSYLAETITATDPAVATPVDITRQKQIIDIVGKIFRGDRQAYQVKGWLDKSGSSWVLKEATKDGTGRTGSVFTLHFNDKSTCTYNQADYHNDTTFACTGGLKPWGMGDRVVVNMDDVFSSDITVRWMYIKSALPISNW